MLGSDEETTPTSRTTTPVQLHPPRSTLHLHRRQHQLQHRKLQNLFPLQHHTSTKCGFNWSLLLGVVDHRLGVLRNANAICDNRGPSSVYATWIARDRIVERDSRRIQREKWYDKQHFFPHVSLQTFEKLIKNSYFNAFFFLYFSADPSDLLMGSISPIRKTNLSVVLEETEDFINLADEPTVADIHNDSIDIANVSTTAEVHSTINNSRSSLSLTHGDNSSIITSRTSASIYEDEDETSRWMYSQLRRGEVQIYAIIIIMILIFCLLLNMFWAEDIWWVECD